MLCYDPNNDTLITSYNFDDANIEDIVPEIAFMVESEWKDISLLYSTV